MILTREQIYFQWYLNLADFGSELGGKDAADCVANSAPERLQFLSQSILREAFTYS